MKSQNRATQPITQGDREVRDQRTLERAYQEGYLKGQHIEKRQQLETQNAAAHTNLVYFLDVLLATAIGVGISFLLFALGKNLGQLESSPHPSPSTSSETIKPAQQETTIIERSVEKAKEVVPTTLPQIQLPQSTPNQPVRQTPSATPSPSEPVQTGQPTANPSPVVPEESAAKDDPQ
jgi:hypothetical protein